MKTFTGIWALTAGIIFLCLCTVNKAMADYTGNDTGNDLAPWYASFRDNIKTVIIEAGVTTVG
jgi:hypothetical protein